MTQSNNTLNFSKMHGLGNDFMVVAAVGEHATKATCCTRPNIRTWSDRHTGIGFDQLMLITEPSPEEADSGVHFHYHIFNADGGKVEQCGNGVRAVAEFCFVKNLSRQTTLQLATATERVQTTRIIPGQISVALAAPIAVYTDKRTDVAGKRIDYCAVQLANPHAVVRVDDVNAAPVTEIGASLGAPSEAFVQGCNVGFMQVVNKHTLKLRVFERGAGETQACGTGAMAAAVAAIQLGVCEGAGIHVHLPGGELVIDWPGANAGITMTGEAVIVYDGEISVPNR